LECPYAGDIFKKGECDDPRCNGCIREGESVTCTLPYCEKECDGDCGDCDDNTDTNYFNLSKCCGDVPCETCIQIRRGPFNQNPFNGMLDLIKISELEYYDPAFPIDNQPPNPEAHH